MHADAVKCTADKKWIHKRCNDVHGDLLLVNRAPLIKALTATGWGKQKETLMATYKAVMRPALECAPSIWMPFHMSLPYASSICIFQMHLPDASSRCL